MADAQTSLTRLKPFPMLHEQHAKSYRVSAAAQLTSGELRLSYKIEGADAKEFSKISVPPIDSSPSRMNELWKTTCFECFVPCLDSEAYLELNLSPSGAWNLYAFKSYREGMTEFQINPLSIPKQTILSRSESELVSEWIVPLTGLRQGMVSVKRNELRLGSLGLTTVLQTSVATTYWALKHDGVKPDFHLRSSFSYSI